MHLPKRLNLSSTPNYVITVPDGARPLVVIVPIINSNLSSFKFLQVSVALYDFCCWANVILNVRRNVGKIQRLSLGLAQYRSVKPSMMYFISQTARIFIFFKFIHIVCLLTTFS